MKTVWALVFLPLVLGIFILFSSSIFNQANALSCNILPSIQQSFEDSGVVFLGEVISKEYFPAKASKFEDSIVKFKLIESFKGFSNETMTVETSEWFYNPTYEVGNDYVVFAFGQPGKALSHRLCTLSSMIPEEKNLEQLRLLSRNETSMPSQNVEATKWYLGINLKEGDFFRYNLCDPNYEYCKPFELDFWVYGKTVDISYGDEIPVWKVKAIVIEENKTIIGDMFLGIIASEAVSSSKDIQQYANFFDSSIAHLSSYAAGTYPKSFERQSWCPIAAHRICFEIVGLEKISVASETFAAYLLRADTDRYDIKIWLDKDLAFPLKGYNFYTDKEGNKIKYYEFELLEFGNSQTPPHFLESFNIEESTAPIEIKSPRHQLSLGVVPEDIICKGRLELVFKFTDGSPACVKPQTAHKLLERGWGSTWGIFIGSIPGK